MPLYEYKCAECGEVIEFRSSYDKKEEMVSSLKCESCGSKKFTQVFSGMAITGSKGEPTPPSGGSYCSGGMCGL
jgi:putative FmdB family regulatory protein